MDITYLLVPCGYLFGSISTAIIICKLMGLPDPRTTGSRNPGATNVARIGGLLKGLIPVLIAHALQADAAVLAGTALAAFIGHLYPIFFGFQGGKGVATALGVIYGLYWPVGLLTTAVWLVVALVFRISSLAALTAMLVMPAGFYWLYPQQPVIVAMVILTALLFWRHRSNIANLVNGTEDRISFGKK